MCEFIAKLTTVLAVIYLILSPIFFGVLYQAVSLTYDGHSTILYNRWDKNQKGEIQEKRYQWINPLITRTEYISHENMVKMEEQCNVTNNVESIFTVTVISEISDNSNDKYDLLIQLEQFNDMRNMTKTYKDVLNDVLNDLCKKSNQKLSFPKIESSMKKILNNKFEDYEWNITDVNLKKKIQQFVNQSDVDWKNNRIQNLEKKVTELKNKVAKLEKEVNSKAEGSCPNNDAATKDNIDRESKKGKSPEEISKEKSKKKAARLEEKSKKKSARREEKFKKKVN